MLDPTAPLPLYAQIHRRLRDLIVRGVLRPGTRLPSTRVLARELGVSRTTALAAYDQLRAERLVSQRRGSGTRVARWRTPNLAVTTRTVGRSSVA